MLKIIFQVEESPTALRQFDLPLCCNKQTPWPDRAGRKLSAPASFWADLLVEQMHGPLRKKIK